VISNSWFSDLVFLTLLGNTCTDVLADLSYNRSMGLIFTKTK